MSSTTPGADPERQDGATGPVDEGLDDATAAPDAHATGPVDEPADIEPESVASPVDPDVSTSTPADEVSEPVADDADLAATSRLDEAVQRASAHPAPDETDGVDETNGIDDVDDSPTPDPVAAGAVRRETYVPAATAAAGTAAGAATLADVPEPVYVAPQPGPQTIYVQAPTPPKAKGNRGFGVLVALIGTVAFGVLYGVVAYVLYLSFGAPEGEAIGIADFLVEPTYWVPVIAFFVGFALLAAIVNRGPWWTYAVFGLLVGVLVYFAYIGGSLLFVQAWTLTLEQANDFIAERWLDPYAIVAAVIAREIPIWLGGWIAARGRTVTERNRLAIEAYDRELAAGPQVQRY
ncbi:rhomboid family intramembrane serine protease [Agromyces cerinus]|uniref:Uncharacterized protein n=1 Tax=Agromyces cerinus subsp. cerinus TaxID=232089 RepID=A0A1N6FCF6_9MICO|nr:rhomboid family intramembrane serine protease [Agromyces cerinus]SIN92876.1 hypothetical protein SAMN05443544_1925 [Agromyces cerinus subsp. cerinus]